MPTSIYHITHIRNLQSILQSGGLIANSRLKQQQTNYQDIAHGHIQDRRALTRVPCSAGGCLHDYVPFYFAPRSPMLYAIHKGNVQGYSGEQNSIIHLVFEAEFLVHQFCPCSLIKEIGVINSKIKAEVGNILQNFNFQIPVRDYSNWYY